MKEKQHVTFNHGYLCEMLRAASDNELANVVKDVQKIQKERVDFRKQMGTFAIKNAIDAAIKDGYIIKFTEECEECPSLVLNSFSLHANNSSHIAITLEEDE